MDEISNWCLRVSGISMIVAILAIIVGILVDNWRLP